MGGVGLLPPFRAAPERNVITVPGIALSQYVFVRDSHSVVRL